MKVAILRGSSMRSGWANAFQSQGHQVTLWEPKEKPAFDFFSEFEPQLLMLGTWELSRAILKNVASRPNLKVLLWGSHYGSFDSEINRQAHGAMLAREDEKQMVEVLRTYRPDIQTVFAPYVQGWVDVTHDRWRNLGLNPVSLLPAADSFVYSNGVFRCELESDVAFIGRYHPSVGSLLLPLCREMRVKIFGPDGWPVAQYLGNVHPQTIKNILSSAKICPILNETAYGFELGERIFQTLAAGSLSVSLSSRDVFTNDEVVFCTPTDFHDTIRHYVAHPEEGIPFVERGLKAVFEHHTYLHRLIQVLPLLEPK